jgi:hypothetical protein
MQTLPTFRKQSAFVFQVKALNLLTNDKSAMPTTPYSPKIRGFKSSGTKVLADRFYFGHNSLLTRSMAFFMVVITQNMAGNV